MAIVHASADVPVNGDSIPVATDDPATADIVENEKTWVDARISIVESGVNPVGVPHTFNVTVEMTADGSTWVPVVGVNVTPRLDPLSTAGSITSTPPYTTNAQGQVFVTVNSSTVGTDRA